ncbi:MAG: hypothetical protein EOO13_09615 [Chitinophagaceae bacterium]|nr:MAG: hypothetical protein EOO13_09615 [Chitinophagaceae bacterium]
MKLNTQEETEIVAAYKSFWAANLSANMEIFGSYLVDDFSIIGSAKGETFFSRKDAIAFYAATAEELKDKAELRNRQIRIQPMEEHSVIVHELCDLYVLLENDWAFYGHARISCVMKKMDGEWKALHQHASFPDHRTEEGRQLAAKKIEKENLELKEAVQRRTDELEYKNRELEIEAALERIRAVAMGMSSTNDLIEIAKVQFTELMQLGFEDVRNSLIGIFHDSKDYFTDYDYSDICGGNITDIPINGNVIIEGAVKRMKSATDVFTEFVVEGQDMAEWKAFRQKNGEYDDPRIKDAAVLYYYFYSVNNGIVGISTFKRISSAQLDILRKFRNVFDLAYKRYLDISKADAQAREAQVELSLERIRAKVTAMKVSNDLLDIVVTMRTEFVALGHEAQYFWHMRWQETMYDKAMTSGDGTRIGNVMTLPRHMHGNIPVIANWENSHKPTLVYAMDVETAIDYVIQMINLGNFEQVDHNAPTLDDMRHIGGLTFVMARTTHGEIGFSLPGRVPNPPADAIATLVRFAAVFDLAYRRFEDLKSSEKQIREAQIELALERVRARTMAMQHSNELADASFVLDTQVRLLGIQTWGCAFNIYGDNESTEWFSSEAGMLPPYKTPREDFFLRAYEAGKKGQQVYVEEFAGEDCKAHYDYLLTIPIMGDALRGMLAAGRSFPERQIDHATFFKYGHLLFITPEYVPDAHDIFIRFAKVFEQTYTRFLDLQKAEAQAVRAEQDLIQIKDARKKAEDTLVELQATQKQLIQSEKMASLGELTAGIAHEIQNPLNFVNNFSEVSNELVEEMNTELDKGDIEEAKAIAGDIKTNLEKINQHGKRADAIVKGMLQHSRKSEGQKEPTDIIALCDEYLRLSWHGLRAKNKSFNATLKTDFDESIGKINIIPQDMGRVVMNLLTNAFYAVNERKSTTDNRPLTTDAIYEPAVSIRTKKINNGVEIIVSDNGNGIPQNIIDKIFQPFFTTKPTGQGTGLGLSLAYDIVKAHVGTLQVFSREKEGTDFIITLPV